MISAVVHTYNEEKNIERCLSSLSFVDEIVLIDMDSKDRTREIASNYKAKIFNHPYTGFVEPARNFGIQKVLGSWVLIVDADEEISKTLADKLISISREKRVDYCRVARKNIIFHKWIKHSGWWPDYQIRFFKKGCVSWSEKIHGVPLTRGTGLDLEANSDLSISHYNYQTIEQYIARLNRYTNISAKEFFLSNKKFSYRDVVNLSSKEFINRYLVWEGYKDGIHGLALAFLQSLSEVVTYLKLWELENFKEERISLLESKEVISDGQNETQYWFYNTLLKEPHDFISDLIWRLKRKLSQHG
ncbi:glycosyltransferase family 2 protein [Candidatus Gottesmanbacteria bacterium]|nr:glycosyltransferase family 2 protein [Candidatus Gottesmanbacteria bacterium]